jgi:hypothetical protein
MKGILFETQTIYRISDAVSDEPRTNNRNGLLCIPTKTQRPVFWFWFCNNANIDTQWHVLKRQKALGRRLCFIVSLCQQWLCSRRLRFCGISAFIRCSTLKDSPLLGQSTFILIRYLDYYAYQDEETKVCRRQRPFSFILSRNLCNLSVSTVMLPQTGEYKHRVSLPMISPSLSSSSFTHSS